MQKYVHIYFIFQAWEMLKLENKINSHLMNHFKVLAIFQELVTSGYSSLGVIVGQQ